MKPKDEKKLAAIIATTCRMAAERGLLGLTLIDIAKAAGIATSTLYVYFADKEALFNEVYRHAKQEAMNFYIEEIDPSAPLKLRVRKVWNRMLDHRLRRYDEVSFMEQFIGSAYMTDEIRAYTAQLSDGLLKIVAEGQREEILKDIPVAYLNACFIGSVRETGRMMRAGLVADSEESRSLAFRLCWDAIRC
ncbi:TetR/AcrR family transcriptional regulator [Undibacterium sp. TS12]|uniref:TetR/AcrR family transcriptional regulator n=1 Tax=Undibacterium sp. TS12 TaxID=2908202 RepID=UPI001F4C6D99|nr:TetR/AcrR family transcriptional regulator [Undibacterium sp. TS12]MCH8621070.1 TetR/AcrR family transcriptional regulator [Undibacterium sp. TS12]